MRRIETWAGIGVVVLLAAFVVPPLRSGDGGAEGGKTTRIIISGNRAVVDGDTVTLDDLGDALRDLGSLDIKVIEDVDVSGTETKEESATREPVKRNEVVRFGKDVIVERDEKVSGDVVVFGGSARVSGVVSGDVVVFGGDLTVEETGDIRGSAVCFGGKIDKRPGGRVGSEEVSFHGGLPIRLTLSPFLHPAGACSFWSGGIGFFAGLVSIFFILLLAAGTLFFFPGALGRVAGALSGDLLRTGLIGFLGEILLVPLFLIVTLILLVSIVGIPLLFFVIPLGILAVFAAFWLGYIGTGLFIGRKIGERASIRGATPVRILMMGVVALLAFYILAGIAGLTGDALWPLRAAFGFLGGAVTWISVTLGLGAVIRTRFGTRPRNMEAAVVPSKPMEETPDATT